MSRKEISSFVGTTLEDIFPMSGSCSFARKSYRSKKDHWSSLECPSASIAQLLRYCGNFLAACGRSLNRLARSKELIPRIAPYIVSEISSLQYVQRRTDQILEPWLPGKEKVTDK
jgi:hypothetical protein